MAGKSLVVTMTDGVTGPRVTVVDGVADPVVTALPTPAYDVLRSSLLSVLNSAPPRTDEDES